MLGLISAREAFRDFAGSYNRQTRKNEWTAPDAVAEAVLRHLPSLPSKGRSLIDLGTGTGLVLHKLQNHFARATGVDFADTMIRQCEKAGLQADFIEYDLNEGPWAFGRKASVVTASGVLEFVPHHEDFLHNMRGVMKPDALAVLTYEIMYPQGKKTWGPRGYPRRPVEMEMVANEKGFAVREHSEFTAYKNMGRPVSYGLMVLARN